MAQAFNYADGLRWFGEGVRALRNRPLGLVGIVVFYVLISGLLSGLPVVGTILAGIWMPFGAVLDAACSAYVEAAVEQMDQQVKAAAAAHGLAGNWRFSPGYGDCPLTAQRSIVDALNATRLIGLTITPTSLLMPTKSVTAVIGLFDGEVHDAQSRPTCNICRMREHCRFRAAHTTCYSSH